jgi:hypothetical protein
MAQIVIGATCDDCKRSYDVHVTGEVGFVAGMTHTPCPSCGKALGPFPGKVLDVTKKLET